MRTSDSLLWKFFKSSGLQKLYHAIKHQLPASLQSKVSDTSLKNVVVPQIISEEIEPKYHAAWTHLLKRGHVAGDYLEFGVSHGTSLSCMHRVLENLKLSSVNIFGFDSFEGMPKSAAEEDLGTWKPGEFASPIEQTKEYLTSKGVDWFRTFLIKGRFDQNLFSSTKQKYSIEKASVIMIDCDIYSSSKLVLDFCAGLITDEAIIFFDDWKDDATFGEHKAYIEFLKTYPHFVSEDFGTYKPTGKIFFVMNVKSARPLPHS